MRITIHHALRQIMGLTEEEIERAFRINSVKVGTKLITQRQSLVDVKEGTKIQALRTNLAVVSAHLDHLGRLVDQKQAAGKLKRR